MKIKLIHCQLLAQTYHGECLVTLERTHGFIWKSIQRFQVRGSLVRWYHYPSGVKCNSTLKWKINEQVLKAGEELERRERVSGWKKE